MLGITIGSKFYTMNGEFIATIESESGVVQDCWIARVDHIYNNMAPIYITYNNSGFEVSTQDADGFDIQLVDPQGFALADKVSFE